MVGRELELAARSTHRGSSRRLIALEVEELSVAGDRGETAVRDVRSRSARARSSGSQASRATASASSPRRSRGFAPLRHGPRGRAGARRRRPARGDPRRRRTRPRGSARHRARSEPQRHEQRRHQDGPDALVLTRAAPRPAADARRRGSHHPRLRRQDARAGDARPQPLGWEPAEARARAGVLRRPARPRRRAAHARPGRGRHRDGSRVPSRGLGEGRRDPPHQRGPRRAPRARGQDPRGLRGRVVGELAAGAASIEEIGYLRPAATAHDQARAQARAALVALPRGAGRVAPRGVRDHGHRPRCERARPGATYRQSSTSGFTGHGALSATLISATPILFTGLAAAVGVPHAALQHRRRGPAVPGSDRRVLDRAAARRPRRDRGAALRRLHVPRSRDPRRALGAHPGRAEGVREHERDHHVADAQLRRGLPPDVPDLRQLLVLARRLDPPGPRVPAGQADAGAPSGRRSARASSSRSGSSWASRSRWACGSCTRARGSASR